MITESFDDKIHLFIQNCLPRSLKPKLVLWKKLHTVVQFYISLDDVNFCAQAILITFLSLPHLGVQPAEIDLA